MIHTIEIEQFLELSKKYPLFDVRSPQEYAQGHIPHGHNLPLFSDEERAIIGTLYKQQGKLVAMQKALEIVGPTLSILVRTVLGVTGQSQEKIILVHCWRGGMRSASVGWLLSLFGYTVYVLKGGYKQFRAYIRKCFQRPYKLCVVSGKTGTGKTELLQLLKNTQQVIDLEQLACHRGSVFGALGVTQPTQEQFDNELGYLLHGFDSTKTVFIEDESRIIGSLSIPFVFFMSLRSAPRKHIDIPFERRLEYILAGYAVMPVEAFYITLKRLEKHLGGARTQEICALYAAGQIREACALLLQYYDAAYDYGERKRQEPAQYVHVAVHQELWNLSERFVV